MVFASPVTKPAHRTAGPDQTTQPMRLLQRQCACGAPSGSDGECEACKKKGQSLQRHVAGGDTPSGHPAKGNATAPPIVHDVLRSSGRPLDPAIRAVMEPRFGHDFSRIRLHTDAQAAASARAVNALAYTVGSHVVFGAGRYAPERTEGHKLLAHELAHTVQQGDQSEGMQRLSLDAHDGPMEREAHAVADAVTSNRPARVNLRSAAAHVQGFWVTKEPAGGCGVCLGEEFPGKGPTNAGRIAHDVIEAAFKTDLAGIGKYRFVEFPVKAPGDENGRLDLAVATPTGFAIGEIKPATPNGEEQGLDDLAWYKKTMSAAYPQSTIEPLVTRVPGNLVFPDPIAAVGGCPPQLLSAVMMSPGLFGYFCNPPFSEARKAPGCKCKPSKEKKKQERRKAVEEVKAQRGSQKRRVRIVGAHPDFQDLARRVETLEAPPERELIVAVDKGLFDQAVNEGNRQRMEQKMRMLQVDPRGVPFIQSTAGLVAIAPYVLAFEIAAVVAMGALPLLLLAPEVGVVAGVGVAATEATGTGAVAAGSTGVTLTLIQGGAAAGATTTAATGGAVVATLTKAAAALVVARLVTGGISEAQAQESVKPLINKQILAVVDVTDTPLNLRNAPQAIGDQDFTPAVRLTTSYTP